MVKYYKGYNPKKKRIPAEYNPEYDRIVCQTIHDFASKVSAKILLDVACGVGFHAAYFAEKGYEVYGTDMAEPAIEELNSLHPEVKSFVGDVDYLPFRDGAFDIVYCFHSFWYFPYPERALDEMIRVTKPDGHLFFDIQSLANPKMRMMHLRARYLDPYLKAILRLFPPARIFYKMVLKHEFEWYGWKHNFTYDTGPTHPNKLYNYFRNKEGIIWETLSASALMAGLEFKNTTYTYKNDARVLFRLTHSSSTLH